MSISVTFGGKGLLPQRTIHTEVSLQFCSMSTNHTSGFTSSTHIDRLGPAHPPPILQAYSTMQQKTVCFLFNLPQRSGQRVGLLILMLSVRFPVVTLNHSDSVFSRKNIAIMCLLIQFIKRLFFLYFIKRKIISN